MFFKFGVWTKQLKQNLDVDNVGILSKSKNKNKQKKIIKLYLRMIYIGKH